MADYILEGKNRPRAGRGRNFSRRLRRGGSCWRWWREGCTVAVAVAVADAATVAGAAIAARKGCCSLPEGVMAAGAAADTAAAATACCSRCRLARLALCFSSLFALARLAGRFFAVAAAGRHKREINIPPGRRSKVSLGLNPNQLCIKSFCKRYV